MKNVPLVVGNRVTYKLKSGCIKTIIITDSEDIEMIKDLEILNVEACLWEKIDFEEDKIMDCDNQETEATRNREKSADEMFEELVYKE